jgi:hypothetical protein
LHACSVSLGTATGARQRQMKSFLFFGAIPRMRLENLLEQKKTTILKKWFDRIVQTYPADTSKFLKSQKDPFANPVGGTFKRGLEAVFDILVNGWDQEAVSSFLDPLIRIRAIQDFSPSQAVGFIFMLKTIVRDVLHKSKRNSYELQELLEFELKVDELGLAAFNIYVNCREKIYELQASEMRKTTFSAFERAGLVVDVPDS